MARPQSQHRFPRAALGVIHGSYEHDGAILGLRYDRKSVTLEHRLDRIEVRVAHASKEEVRIAGRVRIGVSHQELRHDLIRTRIVEQTNVREVDDGE
jgi:hypothetical protein